VVTTFIPGLMSALRFKKLITSIGIPSPAVRWPLSIPWSFVSSMRAAT
jgi:hypothetical protein